MEPVSNGIGGDLFAIVWDPKTKKLYGYNGSGRAAMGRDLAQMIEKVKAVSAKTGKPYAAHIPPLGSLPVTVPGTVDAWFALHEKFGKLPIGDDLDPAIHYAKNGFPVSQLVALYWKHNFAAFEKNAAMIEERDNAKATYLIDGHTPAEGEVFRNPDLAETLSRIAKGGRDEFY
jgi:gamma-glutamyltranspeptidase/glutathione hydrolase